MLPDYEIKSEPEALSGGYINFVWRLIGQKENWIAKQALPFISSMPGISLSPQRLIFEARALRSFGPMGDLVELNTEVVRPPRLLAFDAKLSLLWMEDIGPGPDLYLWLKQTPNDEEITQRAMELAHFLADLHAYSASHNQLAKKFHNLLIQKSRLELQYDLQSWLPPKMYDSSSFTQLAEAVYTFGQRLLEPGKCLVMGDLWPASIYMTERGIRLIDWEFVNWGQPAQDIGHLMAHCWLISEAHAKTNIQVCIDLFWQIFSSNYWQRLEQTFPQLWQENDYESMRIHAGAEILIRTVGPFKEGGYFEDLSIESSQIQKALSLAESLILDYQA